MATDYDSPWKEALDVYFPAFLALFFPHIHADIDWSRGHEFLDKELQKIAPKAASGRLYVDKLVKVWRTNGRETWVLIHVEVQTQRDRHFARRMYGYNRRIAERYNRTVVSLAVLADDDPRWRPDRHEERLWGWSAKMHWPSVKLLDYAGREDVLEASENPFAKVVLAHLKALETRRPEWAADVEVPAGTRVVRARFQCRGRAAALPSDRLADGVARALAGRVPARSRQLRGGPTHGILDRF